MLFSKIDKGLKTYEGKSVYLFGASSAGIRVKKILENYGISITAFVDNNEKKEGTELEGIKVLSYDTLCSDLKEREKYIVQITSVYEMEIAEQLRKDNIEYIFYSEFNLQMKMLAENSLLEENAFLRPYVYDSKWKSYYSGEGLQIREYLMARQIKKAAFNDINIMLSAPKTGNLTIKNSVRTEDVIVLNHSYIYIKEFLESYKNRPPINFLIGVRDVISQNLSLLFELFDGGCLNGIDAMWNNDVQEVFNNYIISDETDHTSWFKYMKDKLHMNYLVQDFFDQQIKYYFDIDIYKYPFDVERGYSIYEIGNMRFMIYQLENMNNLENEIGKFLKIKNFFIKKTNAGEDKWYAKNYKETCKEIILDKKYFNECYSGKYMQHFYSDDDIAKYKMKWERNFERAVK